MNDVGRELLASVNINEATMCNTWFSKCDIYKQTWQHPNINQNNGIVLIILSQINHICGDTETSE